MKKSAALILILGLLFSVAVSAEDTPQEVHIDDYDTIIVGMFEIWKHSDGTWQDTDYDGKRDMPYSIDPRTVSAQLQVSIPEAISNQYNNVHMEIIPMGWEGDDTGDNEALFNKDVDGYSAVIKEDMGLTVDAPTYDLFSLFVLDMRPFEYEGNVDNNGKIDFVLKNQPKLPLKRTWQEQQVEGYGFYLPALVQYYGVPKAVDVEAVEIRKQSPILVNTYQVATAVFKNNGGGKTIFTAQYYACGSQVKEETLEIEAGETLERNFSWRSPVTAGKYSLKIHVVPLPYEKDTTNNTKEVSVTVEGYNYAKPDCEFTSKQSSGWNETYGWTLYHSDTCTDKDGKEVDCSWIEYVSETVSYSESLSAAMIINTKQGIATDRNNHKGSDRESRGSWEIIPWSAHNGLDPNKATRAGYGFEVKVQTTYWTDWETKVPGPASPHGGEYKGPTKLAVQFFNTSGKFVEQLEMEPTKGKIGDKSITWELPIKKHTYQDGQVIYERKHYTDVKNMNGEYCVRIIIFDCGRKPLSICQDEYVIIYGDMYDDIYTRTATSDE